MLDTGMTSRDVLRKIRRAGGVPIRLNQVGSHAKYQVGDCRTIIPVHPGDIPVGTLRSIERDLEPCLGGRWMR
jgi:predicted RNA binding protein YcfA (HicA-like mRNA interferase family)